MLKGKSSMFKGSVTFALLILIFATVLLLSWEENPFRTSLVSLQHQFSPSSSVCNYTKGRWVADRRRPLYSGFGCKKWLSGMWACRLMDRTDFSFESYRWQPEGCKVPEFERFAFLKRRLVAVKSRDISFEVLGDVLPSNGRLEALTVASPKANIKAMQNKTIAFIGDSLGRQQFQSLMCIATGGEDSPEVENVGWEYGLVKPKGAIRPDGWAYRFPNTNTTILYYWSASLSDLVPANTSTTNSSPHIAMHLDRPPAFMRKYLHRFDVLVLNTGHHWNRGKFEGNRWEMHMDGNPIKNKYFSDIKNAKNYTIHSIVNWLDSQLPLNPHLKAFFRTISPRHFKNGDWNSGGSCNNTVPLSRGSEVLLDGSSDESVEKAVEGTGVKILDITALSELRDEGHIAGSKLKPKKGRNITSGNDCLHWCLPGIPDAWNELLIAQI